MQSPATSAVAPTAERRLVSSVWPLGIIMALMLAASLASVLVVSWMHAYSHGEAQWGIAEHQAVYKLHAFADSGREADYQAFVEQLEVPLGDRRARLQLQSDHPDYGVIRAGLLAGQIPDEDIPGAVHLFHLFHAHPLMKIAVGRWTAADDMVVQLKQAGAQLHDYIISGLPMAHPKQARVHELLAQADTLHERIGPLLDDFANAMDKAARQIASILLVLLPIAALLLVLAGIFITRAINRRADSMARALRVLADRLDFQANHDSLTGLSNRAKFESLLDAAVRTQRDAVTPDPAERCALLYFDLDQFKVINDTAGHAAGDELIKQVAWRVRRQIRTGDTLARLGGDEFGVLLVGCSVEAALTRAEAIRESVNDLRFYWNDKTFSVSASIGVLPLDACITSTPEAMSAADQACYLAKDNGRNRVQLYRPDDQQVQMRRGEMNWIEHLQAALDNDGFMLMAQEIQPLTQPPAGAAYANRQFELLLRLVDADGQMIAPMAFIPAAERYGLMPRIDRWVIARACLELSILRAHGAILPTCMINLSGTSVSDPTLADYIAACLAEHSLRGSYIGFELTETAAVSNLGSCSQLMSRLRQLGCLISLDDFGSGMSSFSYLRALPIDLLKIDRSFIRDIGSDPIDHAMVETIHRIGSIMGVRTVAEGVESADVLEQLMLIGVDFAQGYYLHRPMPLAQLQDLPPRAIPARAGHGHPNVVHLHALPHVL